MVANRSHLFYGKGSAETFYACCESWGAVSTVGKGVYLFACFVVPIAFRMVRDYTRRKHLRGTKFENTPYLDSKISQERGIFYKFSG